MMRGKNSVCIFSILLSIFIGLPEKTLAKEAEVIAVAEQYAPYMDADLPDQGFIPELVREALGKSGYTVITRFSAWARAIKDAEFGEVDLIYGVYYTQERERFLKYSPPVAENQNVLLSKKGKNIRYQQLADLKPYQIGVIRGAAHGDEFDKATFLNKVEIPDSMQNIKKLVADRIDLIAGPKDVILYRVKKEYPQFYDQIEVLHPALSNTKMYVGFSKKVERHQKLYDAFVKGLDQMKKDGTFIKIAKKNGVEPYNAMNASGGRGTKQ